VHHPCRYGEPGSARLYRRIAKYNKETQRFLCDGPLKTYRAGESFSEFPGDRHNVSENASTTEPARLPAVFVADTADTVLTTPYEK
jgi:hypothetical protein